MLRNTSLQVMTFICFQLFLCNHMSKDVFCLWDVVKAQFLKEMLHILNISYYCSNNRFISVCTLAFFDNSS
ncbi:hypothetical protein ES319_A01G216400v1 [Gossypium barbadense]|uniref:Secreted protein n=2 Tax=Gossypium TaxID=3633 RepID=A0A5J5X0Y2_GOSBA|nr:hypothetical protein ES319_A01G216400v1 [Gossypium barbadense]TYH32204.1 hypothetical protein ES288_A01G233700v1 [Gossypium darwinii]